MVTVPQSRSWTSGKCAAILFWAALVLAVPSAFSQTFTNLYSFNASGDLSDGGYPKAGVVRDAAGNLYGTTFFGGTGSGCDIFFAGCGAIFKLDLNGAQTVLHSFGGTFDGWNPTASVTVDAAGNLYGVTAYGGAHGYGTVFKLDAVGHEIILHGFAGGSDGATPRAGLAQDASGNLYGTTEYGGTGCNGRGCGTVFRITASGQETVLYRFTDLPDGSSPLAGVTLDSAGNIYGTTWLGGVYSQGTVFRLDPSGNETVLYNFAGGNDGSNPLGGVVLDNAGNLYGTTTAGGSVLGFGIIFKLDIAGNESVLYSFTGGSDGAYPYSTLVSDSAGNLYGTASQGFGSVFELSGGSLIVLYDFIGSSDGANPMAGVVMDSAGNLYGTTVQAGVNGWGTVFEIQR